MAVAEAKTAKVARKAGMEIRIPVRCREMLYSMMGEGEVRVEYCRNDVDMRVMITTLGLLLLSNSCPPSASQ